MCHWEKVGLKVGYLVCCAAILLSLASTARAAPVQPVIQQCKADFQDANPADRTMKIALGYMLGNLFDQPERAIAETESIELWVATAFTNGNPPSFEYVATVYPWSEGSDTDKYAPRTGSGERNVPADGSLGEQFEFPVPSPAFSIEPAPSESYYYLRVRADGALQEHDDARRAGASCLRPELVRFQTPGFKLIGGLGVLDPWNVGGSCNAVGTPHCRRAFRCSRTSKMHCAR
jgi:hypothetical protein